MLFTSLVLKYSREDIFETASNRYKGFYLFFAIFESIKLKFIL